MSSEHDGFLSTDIVRQIAVIRRRYVEWFDLAEWLNKLGQRIVLTQRELETDRSLADHRVVAMLFYIRALSSFQAALVLAERGMIVEANTMARALIETTWVLGGLHKDKERFVKKLADADYAERQASGNWYLNNPAMTAHVKAKNIATLKKFISSLTKSEVPLKKLIFGNVAADTGLHELYAVYRHLSHHYAHPSVTAVSIFTHRGPAPGDHNIFWNTEYGIRGVPEAIGYLCNSMFAASLAINEIISTDTVASELTKAFKRYRILIGALVKKPRKKTSRKLRKSARQ